MIRVTEDLMNEIVPGVYVGNVYASRLHRNFEGWCIIDVRESDSIPARNVQNVPLLRAETNWNAGKRALEEIASLIDFAIEQGDKVLVHCWAGMERSPLAVAYWLVTRKGHTFQSAYNLLKSKRRVVQNRSAWLTRKARAELVAANQGTVAA